MTLADFRVAREQRKRDAILLAARRAFAEGGFGAASMSDVAAQAGVSTATLYRYYGSKSGLFSAVVLGSMDRLSAALAQPQGAAQTALRELACAYASLLCDPDVVGIVRAVIAEAAQHPDLASGFYEAGKRAAGDLFERAARRAFEEADQTPPADLRAASGRLQGMIEHFSLLPALLTGHAAVDAAKARAEDAVRDWLSAQGLNRPSHFQQ